MRVLGIETSCDETAAAVVDNGRSVRSNIVYTQIAQHQPYGGVVPEIACRAHLEQVSFIIEQALEGADTSWDELDAIAVTRGPGLASSLLIGIAAAKGLSLSLDKPLLGVNHLEGHAYSVFLGDDAPLPADVCPLVILLATGGHTSLILMRGLGDYETLASTCDDAAGEALDKGAKLLGLGYPGGPEIERAAEGGDPHAIDFPRGFKGHKEELRFSFSGLKTSLLYYRKNNPDTPLADVAASYQEAVVDALARQLEKALKLHPEVKAFACVGGVAKNKRLRARLDQLADKTRLPLLLTEMQYCTDNAAMIAGIAGARPHEPAPMELDARPNLSLGK
jgi:N6-L-threonylcarbamoyladenine synthase